MVYKDADDAGAVRPEARRFSARTITGSYEDLIVLIGFSVVTLAIVVTPYFEHSILRLVAGTVFVLFVPGYTFIAAIYPGKDDLGHLERFLLSATFSIVLVPLLGFIFNFTVWGIRFDTMIFTTMTIAVICSVAAHLRRHSLPVSERFIIDPARPVRDTWKFLLPASKHRADQLLSVLLICGILMTIAATAYAVMVPRPGEKYTEFYILGPSGNLSDYPASVQLGESAQITAVISNHEGSEKIYDVVVTTDGIGSQRHRIYSDRFILADNQTLETVINLQPEREDTRMNVEFLLHMDGVADRPYRSCNLWLKVTVPPGTRAVSA